MKEIRLKISDLFEIDPHTGDRPKDLESITAYVLKHYAFLPLPISVVVEGDEVVISHPDGADAKRAVAARLVETSREAGARGRLQKSHWDLQEGARIRPLTARGPS
jgi:hypothetical protein